MRSYISRYGTYFSISLFLQVRGAEEEEHGVLGSVLLLSPLLVEGISANTDETDKYLNLIKNLTLSQQNVRLEQKLLTIIGPLGEFRRYSVGGHPPAAGETNVSTDLASAGNGRRSRVLLEHGSS